MSLAYSLCEENISNIGMHKDDYFSEIINLGEYRDCKEFVSIVNNKKLFSFGLILLELKLITTEEFDLFFSQSSYEEIPFINFIYIRTTFSNWLFFQICIYQLWLSQGNSNLKKKLHIPRFNSWRRMSLRMGGKSSFLNGTFTNYKMLLSLCSQSQNEHVPCTKKSQDCHNLCQLLRL